MLESRTVYPPLDVLKPVAPDIWIVDSGPLHAMGLAIPVRMTVVRLKSGDLWLHSPTRYDEGLDSELHRIGTIRHLVAPNVAHWSFLKDWQARYPDVVTWALDIEQAVVPGGFGVNEVAFFHRSTSTLVLTDLIQNFEPEKISPLVRPLVRLAGAIAPNGKAPVHLRFAINRKRDIAAAAA